MRPVDRRTFLRASAALGLAAVRPAGSALAASSIRAAEVMAAAEQYLGVPYVYGGNDPVRGLDCSSYVSLIWRIPRQSTDTMHNYASEIDADELMPGDAMNFPYQGRRSHMRLFAGWATEDRKAVWVYECAFRRGVNHRPIAYDDRYTPIRRHGFVPDVPQPAPSLPVEYEVPGGRFFSQPGSGDGLTGFAVLDKDEVRFWTEFRRLGGVDALGLPLSRPFELLGATLQRFERGLLRWLPDARRAVVVYGVLPPPEATELQPTPLTQPPDPGVMSGFPPRPA